ncbi:hypothetical protein ACQEVF_32690 [Nonomuraea polychroma]|uniref:hypothetical protein n=1 Tax=Nonomuraea polychroma TaxID=46176 RepID=UPI003D8D4A65
MTRRLITTEELAEILGLVREDGTPMTHGIHVKAASKEWPSRLVLGKLRFAEDDVEAIIAICKRGGETPAVPASPPEPKPRRRRRDKTPASAASVPSAFGDLTPLPIRDRTRP